MKPWRRDGAVEILGICFLALLAAWFLHASWRKWADPIIDSGPQWYAIWRTSLGEVPYHDFTWNYGPVSLLFDGLLFKCFGPGMMVLAAANLVVYAAIVVLAWLAFRMAWGRLAAFAALAVFISVFSFSLLNSVGNYNYVLPYANETTHGMLLLLVTAHVMVRWCAKPSRAGACLLGLCGGVAAVLKPEFMLAGGVVGIAALLLRFLQRQPPGLAEWGLILAGVALPTLLFSVWFARSEPWSAALVDSSQAWWLLVVNQKGPKLADEVTFLGWDYAGRNFWWELACALSAVLIIGAIWAAGWFVNRPWRPILKWALALAAGFLACSVDLGGGFEVGPCLPGLIIIALIIVAADLLRDLRRSGRAGPGALMALSLVLLAAAMLTRMALRSRLNHFGFIQAALAGMVAAAVMLSKVPRWTGRGLWGRWVSTIGIMALLAAGCYSVAAESAGIHAEQTQPVGSGADRFYALGPEVDETGQVVNWCAEHMHSVSPQSTLLVLPEGVMINYLSRLRRPMPEFMTNDDKSGEEKYIKQLAEVRPDYTIVIWGDQRDGGLGRFGDPGQDGAQITQWIKQNYAIEDTHRGHSKWAFILHKKAGP